MSELKIGDVVQLKSGGPAMTIEWLGKGMMDDVQKASCTWFEGKKHSKADFSVSSLKKYEPRKRVSTVRARF